MITVYDTIEFLNLPEENVTDEYFLKSVQYITDLRNNKPIPYWLPDKVRYFVNHLCDKHSISIIYSKVEVEKEIEKHQYHLKVIERDMEKLQKTKNNLNDWLEELTKINDTNTI